MFRIIQSSKSLPASFICDPSAEFEPGHVGELTVMANQVMCTVSTGVAPIGIIDDIKTRSFTSVSWNEEKIVSAVGTTSPSGQIVLANEVKVELNKSNIVAGSFGSTVPCLLNANNGIITFTAGTPLNFDSTGSGIPNGIRTIVNYTYFVANIPGDDSTIGNGRVTIWYDRMFFQSSIIETNVNYPVRANVYVNDRGQITTRKTLANAPAVGMVTAPPITANPLVEIFWF